jgi:hypothetical protein
MKDLLIHTSDKKVDVLLPQSEHEDCRPCICFSLNQFISFFGQYTYLFEKEILEKNFAVRRIPSQGVECFANVRGNFEQHEQGVRFVSQELGWEFRVYEPINVERYWLAILTNFNHMKGVLETKLGDKLVKELIDFSRESE